MKRTLIYFTIISLLGCSTPKNIDGLYGKCNERYFACTQLLLNKDKTFEFFEFMDVGGKQILKGTWNRKGKDSIVLNTLEQPKIPKTYFVSNNNFDLHDQIRIQLRDSESGLALGAVSIDNKYLRSTDEQGYVYFDKQNFETIQYSFLNITGELTITDAKFNDYTIYLRDLGSPLLTNEVFIRKKNKIQLPNRNNKRKYYLKKTELKEKQW